MPEFSSKQILDALERYWPKQSYAHVREFRPYTGYKGDERRIDLWVIDRAPSAGMPAHAVEVKVSRADWLREIKTPIKARLALAVSNFMWVAAPPGVVKTEELPPMWGRLEVNPTAEDAWERVRKIHPAEYRDKVRPTWGLVASLIRKLGTPECGDGNVKV